MDQDKNNDEDTKLDTSYIEFCIFSIIKIDLLHLVKIKSSLAKNFHIQPSEIDNMPMWEYELFIKYINESVKEENEEQQKEMDKYNINDYKNPKLPTAPKMPKIPKM